MLRESFGEIQTGEQFNLLIVYELVFYLQNCSTKHQADYFEAFLQNTKVAN
jgi:hypothetical protein